MSMSRNFEACGRNYSIHVEVKGMQAGFDSAACERDMRLILSSRLMISAYDGAFCDEARVTSPIKRAYLRIPCASEHDAFSVCVVVRPSKKSLTIRMRPIIRSLCVDVMQPRRIIRWSPDIETLRGSKVSTDALFKFTLTHLPSVCHIEHPKHHPATLNFLC
jgi:hypothetical protein